ncbi:MAG: hypothetical protein IKZ37_08895 [Bacteroidaceae bacterium]|nr:hypothetical protein [Bacteroidaceae bacterium]
MSLSKQSTSNLREAIVQMTKRFTTTEETIVTDFHFQLNTESGNLSIFDDDDNTLATAHIAEWEKFHQEDCYEVIENELRKLLNEIQKEGVLDNMNVPKPYSCLLVDDDKETIVDLLYVDDETYIITNDLLEGFDKEMDEFLRHLLEE